MVGDESSMRGAKKVMQWCCCVVGVAQQQKIICRTQKVTFLKGQFLVLKANQKLHPQLGTANHVREVDRVRTVVRVCGTSE